MTERSEEEENFYHQTVQQLAKEVYGDNIKSLKVTFNSQYDDEGYDHELVLHAVNDKGLFIDPVTYAKNDMLRLSYPKLQHEIREFHDIVGGRWDDDSEGYNDYIRDYILTF